MALSYVNKICGKFIKVMNGSMLVIVIICLEKVTWLVTLCALTREHGYVHNLNCAGSVLFAISSQHLFGNRNSSTLHPIVYILNAGRGRKKYIEAS